MNNASARAVILPGASGITGTITSWSKAIADGVDVTRPAEQARLAHRLVLFLIIAGGVVVRFVGLGSVGLHGDEETMALAVRGIVEGGTPILPSGMFYPRGMTQLYLMAASVSLFGESEWALRLPSVLCGTALIGLSYLLGRRFLRPAWSLALAATVAFLPDLIVDSQTARMYIFLITATALAMICLFEWERTDHVGWLAAAVLALIAGIDFHLLAVTAILMLPLPGLFRGNVAKLLHGTFAALVVLVAFVLIDAWTSSKYPVPPPEFAAEISDDASERPFSLRHLPLVVQWAFWGSAIVFAILAQRVSRNVAHRGAALISFSLLLLGAVLQLALYYHLAALLYAGGALVAVKYGSRNMIRPLLPLGITVVLLAAVHAWLIVPLTNSIIQLVGAMIGQPSVWPYVRVAQLSETTGVLVAALLLWGAWQWAQNRRVPDYWMLAAAGVWAPVFALGMFAWNVPPRYTEGSLMPMLLCGFAAAQQGTTWLLARLQRVSLKSHVHAFAAVVVALCAINPVASASVINAGYRIHPDHRGAAKFLESQNLTEEDVVLAEDVLQQTYYLGSVDYWLIGRRIAQQFVKRHGDGVVDFYTGTPPLVSAAMLDEVLQKNTDKRVFVIGSGEQQEDGRRGARGEELHSAIESQRFEVVYTGRDGKTRVWRAQPRAAAPSVQTTIRAQSDRKALEDSVPVQPQPSQQNEASQPSTRPLPVP